MASRSTEADADRTAAARVPNTPEGRWGESELVARIDGETGKLLTAPGMERTLGLEVGTLVGVDLFDVLCPSAVPRFVSTLTVLLDQPGTTRATELGLCWADRDRVDLAVLARQEDPAGGPVVTLDRVRDVPLWAAAGQDLTSDRGVLKAELAVSMVRGEVPMIVAVKVEHLDTIEAAYGERAFGQLVGLIGNRVSTNVDGVRAYALVGASTMCFLVSEAPTSTTPPLDAGNQVRDLLSLPFDLGDTEVFLFPRIAVGTALGDQPEPALRATLRAVERLSGPTVLQVIDNVDRDVAVRELRLRNELRYAIERDELRVLLQPVVDTRTGHVAGAEALVRWEHSELGQLGPDEFISLAEETDFIDAIGAWVVRTVTGWATRWLPSPSDGSRFVVSVNVSPRQLVDNSTIDTIADALAVAGLDPALLCCEVTESAVLGDAPEVHAVLHGLVDLGVRIAIDDFGTGHATLDYLQRVPATTLKIDQQFIQPLPDDPPAVELVRGIVDLAHTVGKDVVAEGVETAGQAEALRSLGCDFLQGNLISRPLDQGHFESLMTATAELPLLEPSSAPSAPAVGRSVVLVDGELAFLGAVRAALDPSRISVTGTASSIEEAAEVVRRVQPDVIVSERQLPEGDITDELGRYREAAPDAAVLVFTRTPDERSLTRALDAGAKGYLDKQSTFEELVTAIDRVAEGEVCVAAHLLPLLTRRSTGGDHPSLTDRELDVVAMLARGSSTSEIAAELFLAVNTVRNHIARLLNKLGARTRLEAVAIAADLGIVQR